MCRLQGRRPRQQRRRGAAISRSRLPNRAVGSLSPESGPWRVPDRIGTRLQMDDLLGRAPIMDASNAEAQGLSAARSPNGGLRVDAAASIAWPHGATTSPAPTGGRLDGRARRTVDSISQASTQEPHGVEPHTSVFLEPPSCMPVGDGFLRRISRDFRGRARCAGTGARLRTRRRCRQGSCSSRRALLRSRARRRCGSRLCAGLDVRERTRIATRRCARRGPLRARRERGTRICGSDARVLVRRPGRAARLPAAGRSAGRIGAAGIAPRTGARRVRQPPAHGNNGWPIWWSEWHLATASIRGLRWR